jgi:GMC oxidoreductase
VEQVLCALYGDRAMNARTSFRAIIFRHHDVLLIDATHCNHVLPPGRDGEDGSRRPVRRPRRPQGCGIDNLRIADASIMPRITSRNIMTPCVVIGERAAQVLMADQRSDPRQPSA